MSNPTTTLSPMETEALTRRGLRLAQFTVGYNVVEGVVARAQRVDRQPDPAGLDLDEAVLVAEHVRPGAYVLCDEDGFVEVQTRGVRLAVDPLGAGNDAFDDVVADGELGQAQPATGEGFGLHRRQGGGGVAHRSPSVDVP